MISLFQAIMEIGRSQREEERRREEEGSSLTENLQKAAE